MIFAISSRLKRCLARLLLFSFIFSCWTTIQVEAANVYKDGRVVLGYIPLQREVSDMQWGSLSHANLAFAVVNSTGDIFFQGTMVNSTVKTEDNAVKLIKDGHEKGVKMLVAVGGQGTLSDTLAKVLNIATTRNAFISNSIDFVEKYQLDGIDVDWEYPETLIDANVLLLTLRGLRKALNDKFGDGKKVLTITLYNHPYLGPNVPTVDYEPYADAVDYGMVMSYDYFGPWADNSAPNAPFLDVPFYMGSYRNTTDAWLQAGWPAEKLVAGLAFYGHSSIVAVDMTKNLTNQYAPIDNHRSLDGPVSKIDKTWTWRDLRDPKDGALSGPREARDGWVRVWDNATMTPWVFRKEDSLYIGYDDKDSLALKVDYALKKKLAGVMIWEIGYDYNSELMDHVRSFIIKRDEGNEPRNCVPSDSDLDLLYNSTRNPNFFKVRSTIPNLVKRDEDAGMICYFNEEDGSTPDTSDGIVDSDDDSCGLVLAHGVSSLYPIFVSLLLSFAVSMVAY